MPHFGLMDEGKLSQEDAALQRARLHVRCGRRRMIERKYADGIATLYDAVLSGMRWFALTTDPIHEELHRRGEYIFEDDEKLHDLLRESGAWPDNFDFPLLQRTLSDALDNCLENVDYALFLSHVELALESLGVTPFDEMSLPPEDPRTV
jgi:hypothetical protein